MLEFEGHSEEYLRLERDYELMKNSIEQQTQQLEE